MTQKRVSDLPSGGIPQDSDLMLISRIDATSKTSMSVKAGDLKSYLGDATSLGGRPASDYALKSNVTRQQLENGWLIKEGDYVRLEIDVDNFVGNVTLPYTFNKITYCGVTPRFETSRAPWAGIVSRPTSGNVVQGYCYYMKHGNLDSADSCGGYLIVSGT